MEKFSYEAVQNSEMKLRELEEPVEEYVRYVLSVKATLARSAEKKAAVRSAQLDLELKEQAYSKVMGVAGKEKDAVTKQEAVDKAQQLYQTLKTEYEALNDQVLSEFASFKKQKSEDYRNIVLRFAMVEVCISMSRNIYIYIDSLRHHHNSLHRFIFLLLTYVYMCDLCE